MTHIAEERPEDERPEDERPELDQKLSELEILRQSLEESHAKEKDLYDQLLRLGAEFENYRKRSETRLAESRQYGREDVLIQVVTLFDALIQAESACDQAKDLKSVKKGLTLLNQLFEKFMKAQGLVPIKAKGEKLDPHVHEVISQKALPDQEEGTILEEVQRGYKLSDRVLRPSRVIVSTTPKEAAKEQDTQEEKHV